jgi:regulatory protein
MDQNSQVALARRYAFILLKVRPRSETEILDRLRRKRYPEEIIALTLDFLKTKGFIDDRAFARLWCESRLKKPYGVRRIALELRQKGIAAPIVDDVISAARIAYDEPHIVRELALKQWNKRGSQDKQKAQQKVYAYLVRRGFSPDTVADTVSSL